MNLTRRVSSILLLLGAPAVLTIIIAVWMISPHVMHQYTGSPVNYVSVDGGINSRQRAEIYGQLSILTFQKQEIENLKQQLEAISWVNNVTIRRKWPDGLAISVQPQRPIALWNDDAFINDQGEVFLSSFGPDSHLAQLYGPAGSERQVMQQYQQLNNALLKANQSIDVLTLDERGSWIFRNNSGVEVLLGKHELMERIQRLLLVSEHVDLIGRLEHVRTMDTRYSNGVAVSWMQATDGMDLIRTFNSQREFNL